jgi:hypothetical protein
LLLSSWIARREAAHTGGQRLCPDMGGVPAGGGQPLLNKATHNQCPTPASVTGAANLHQKAGESDPLPRLCTYAQAWSACTTTALPSRRPRHRDSQQQHANKLYRQPCQTSLRQSTLWHSLGRLSRCKQQARPTWPPKGAPQHAPRLVVRENLTASCLAQGCKPHKGNGHGQGDCPHLRTIRTSLALALHPTPPTTSPAVITIWHKCDCVPTAKYSKLCHGSPHALHIITAHATSP